MIKSVPNNNDIILDSITDGVFTVDLNWKVTSFNRAAENITGISRRDALGQPCSYVFRASICEGGCAMRKTLETKKPLKNMQIYILNAKGVRVPVSISTAILRDSNGNIVGGVETFRDISAEEELKRELKGSFTFADIISRNHRMKEIFSILPAVADSPATVLVEGESGTGKELICRAIHNLSPRNKSPFVAINCGALPDTLLESELFGYKAGAFTDAKTDKKGRFALAEGGTILLDEIGDISPAFQVKLLRVLQEKKYEPLGSGITVDSDVRILASTNRNLEELIENDLFRRDLYYRINVVRIKIPPLRERKDDILLLAEHFVSHFNKLHKKSIEGISDSAMSALLNHDYPGNIRELENIIEHAFVLCRDGLIMPYHLPEQFGGAMFNSKEKKPDTFRDIEIKAIRDALSRNEFNRVAAARELGIHKTTLHRKIKEYHIILPVNDGRSSRSKILK